ncbi:hypothetical protein ACRRTK_010238 [Alexandromys fortis]
MHAAICPQPHFPGYARIPSESRDLMTNPMMSVNPLLAASGHQRIPLIPAPFGPPIVDRDVLSSSVAPAGPSQFCVPSQSGSSFVPNANVLNRLSGHFYPGWGILPPEPTKAVATRNEMFERHHTARSTSRHLRRNPILLENRPHFTECWGQKYRLRRGSVYQKPLESDTGSFKNQAEEKDSGQMPVVPCEEEEDSKDPEIEVDNIRKSRETDEKSTWGLANTCIEPQPSQTKPCSPEAKAWDSGKEKPSEQVCGDRDEKNGLGLPVSMLPLPGAQALGALSEACSSTDIQKWTVDDVHGFIRSLPGCSNYAQVFKDHAIDGETLPLLTEQHLRGTMGLKLGPALKIQSQHRQKRQQEAEDRQQAASNFDNTEDLKHGSTNYLRHRHVGPDEDKKKWCEGTDGLAG